MREHKGKSLLESLSDYVVIDLETTGLDPEYDTIIELGAARVVNNKITEQFCSLAKPNYQIDEFITELTGITDDMLKDAPRLIDILPEYLNFLGDSIVVGHNVNFDVNFLYDWCHYLLGKPFVNSFIDTMRISRRIFTEHSHHRLCDLIERFNLGSAVEHRALGDAVQAHRCYEYLKQHALNNNIEFSSLYPKTYEKTKAKDITATTTELDEGSEIYGKYFVFTGILEKMVRKDAMQVVVNMGGTCGDTVNKQTNYLVLGNNDYCKTIRGGKSSKQKRAEELKLSGRDIEIISENVFYDLIGDYKE